MARENLLAELIRSTTDEALIGAFAMQVDTPEVTDEELKLTLEWYKMQGWI